MRGGLLIKEARRRAGLTQKQLADRLGTSQPVVARWESSKRSPAFETVVKAVRACGFDLSVSMPTYDEQDIAQAAQNVRRSPAQRLESLINMLEVEKQLRTARRVNEPI
jgi:transcriptional regulator with XRE-family HTH domain